MQQIQPDDHYPPPSDETKKGYDPTSGYSRISLCSNGVRYSEYRLSACAGVSAPDSQAALESDSASEASAVAAAAVEARDSFRCCSAAADVPTVARAVTAPL